MSQPLRNDWRSLGGRVVSPGELGAAQRDQLFALLNHYFLGVQRNHFEDDLERQDWVLLLLAGQEQDIQGFSTLRRLLLDLDGRRIVAFVSGGTIVTPLSRGSVALPRLWARVVFSLAAEDRLAGARAYWVLSTPAYRTYRFLPVFFRHYCPCCDSKTPPWVARLRDRLGELAFGAAYEKERGIFHPPHPALLRPGVADLAPSHLQNPHARFFLATNPGYAAGDELVCLAEISEPNLTQAGRRMLGLPRELH